MKNMASMGRQVAVLLEVWLRYLLACGADCISHLI
jgi:hypothetical protein